MRKILTKFMSVAMTGVMAVSVISFTPANVSAAAGDKAKLGEWKLFQSGDVCSKWDPGDLSLLNSVTFSDGTVFSGSELKTPTITETNDVLGGYTYFQNSSNGFVADIESNGWQADYAPIAAYAKNNPWTIRMEMPGIKTNFGEKYKVNFTAVVKECAAYDAKFANVVISDSDTNVLFAKTIAITKESQDFSFDIDVIYKDELQFQLFLGAFNIPGGDDHPLVDPIVDHAEANWKGVLEVSNLEFVDTGVKSEKIKTVKFVDAGKTVKTVVVNVDDESTTISPVSVKKKGYIFDGWYNGSSKFNFKNSVTKDLTLTAKWTKVKKPGKAKISSIASNKSKQITVKVKKISKVTGYKYQLFNAKGKKVGKAVSSSKTKYTFKKLKSGEKYSVKVKAYVTDSTGKKYESKSWSKAKKCYAN